MQIFLHADCGVYILSGWKSISWSLVGFPFPRIQPFDDGGVKYMINVPGGWSGTLPIPHSWVVLDLSQRKHSVLWTNTNTLFFFLCVPMFWRSRLEWFLMLTLNYSKMQKWWTKTALDIATIILDDNEGRKHIQNTGTLSWGGTGVIWRKSKSRWEKKNGVEALYVQHGVNELIEGTESLIPEAVFLP